MSRTYKNQIKARPETQRIRQEFPRIGLPALKDRRRPDAKRPADYNFFRAMGNTAKYAIALARAERWAATTDHRFVWEYDNSGFSYGDLWPDHDEYCPTYKRAAHLHEHENHQYSCRCVERACNHEIECCMLLAPRRPADSADITHNGVCRCDERHSTDTILESLYGIIDADAKYRREIEAELAAESLASMRHAWTSTEHITAALHA